MGQTRVRALQRSDRVRIVAVADPSSSVRSTLDVPGIAVHEDGQSMLRAGSVDGLLIATPSYLHLQQIKELGKAGLPMLCEKPCGVTSAQAREAAEQGVALQVAYWRRYVPSSRTLRHRIATKEFGDLYLISCYQWDERPPPAAFRVRSGGIFIDMGVHEFDQIRWLTGQEVGRLHICLSAVSSEPIVPGDTESAQVLGELSDGTTALVSLGRRYRPGDICRVELCGTRDDEDCRFLWPPTAEQVFMEALRLQAESFVRWVEGGPMEGATPADAVAAMVIAERSSAAALRERILADAGGAPSKQ
jgi:myo-inositol 2-dehydrogenase/D-chiro-inositol 1-dehydrogenase